MTPPYRSSKLPSCVEPRPYTDPCLRLRKHGPVQPMDEPAGTFIRDTLIVGGTIVVLVLLIVAFSDAPRSGSALSPASAAEHGAGQKGASQ